MIRHWRASPLRGRLRRCLATLRVTRLEPQGSFPVPYAIYNLGNSSPVDLLYFIECIEDALGKKAEKKLLPIQPGDVAETFADITESERDLGFQPSIGIEEGIEYFVDWYLSYHGKSQNLFSTSLKVSVHTPTP